MRNAIITIVQQPENVRESLFRQAFVGAISLMDCSPSIAHQLRGDELDFGLADVQKGLALERLIDTFCDRDMKPSTNAIIEEFAKLAPDQQISKVTYESYLKKLSKIPGAKPKLDKIHLTAVYMISNLLIFVNCVVATMPGAGSASDVRQTFETLAKQLNNPEIGMGVRYQSESRDTHPAIKPWLRLLDEMGLKINKKIKPYLVNMIFTYAKYAPLYHVHDKLAGIKQLISQRQYQYPTGFLGMSLKRDKLIIELTELFERYDDNVWYREEDPRLIQEILAILRKATKSSPIKKEAGEVLTGLPEDLDAYLDNLVHSSMSALASTF